MTLPKEHPLRYRLFNESHTRPYVDLTSPLQVSYLVLLTGEVTSKKECAHLSQLAEQYGVTPPIDNAVHYDANVGNFSIKWEKHTEFSSYTFTSTKQCQSPFSCKVINEVPEGWISSIEGELLIAQHIEILPKCEETLTEEAISKHFQTDSLVGSFVGGTAAQAWTDFKLQKDGFSEVLILNDCLTPQTMGRLVQHMLELETYRLLALLGLPLVEKYGMKITQLGASLTDITHRLSTTTNFEEEQTLLADLTTLEADIEQIIAATSYRFSATQAYKAIVNDRLQRIRENRIDGRQMLSKYLERRFQPAMNACESISSRLENLSVRVARASQILMARVDLALESQNQELLNSMNKRTDLQLRLQGTVEGLSIAAISYYIVGLTSYLARALNAAGANLNIDLFVGVSIPIVVGVVWLSIHKIKKHIYKTT
jgi:uncharacterized membrane-anchored protein